MKVRDLINVMDFDNNYLKIKLVCNQYLNIDKYFGDNEILEKEIKELLACCGQFEGTIIIKLIDEEV